MTSDSSGGKRLCLDSAVKHSRAGVPYWELAHHPESSGVAPRAAPRAAERRGHWNGGTLNLSIQLCPTSNYCTVLPLPDVLKTHLVKAEIVVGWS